MYRLGNNLNETTMVVSSEHERVAHDEINHVNSDDCTVLNNPIEIYQHIIETLKKDSVMAIQEDYPAWKESNFENERAKLLMID